MSFLHDYGSMVVVDDDLRRRDQNFVVIDDLEDQSNDSKTYQMENREIDFFGDPNQDAFVCEVL